MILSSGKDVALVDCGSANSWYGSGSEAADYLFSMGHQDVDYLILTHYDSDHINGIAQLFSRMKVRECLLSTVVDEDDLQVEILDLTEEYGVGVRWIDEKTEIADLLLIGTHFREIICDISERTLQRKSL